MSQSSSGVGFDGVRFRFTSTIDGVATTARIATGTHTDAEHDAAIASLRQAYATLRQWSVDAATTNTNWPTMTAVQKDATQREVIRRLGIFFDRFADFLVANNADS